MPIFINFEFCFFRPMMPIMIDGMAMVTMVMIEKSRAGWDFM